MGQLVDLITASEDVVDLSKFSLQKHQFTVVYKTAYYSFYLPVALAMHVCGITAPSSFDLASKILIPLGEYFQVQDDYLDCFGTHEQIGQDRHRHHRQQMLLAHQRRPCPCVDGASARSSTTATGGRTQRRSVVKEVYHALGLQKRYDYEQSSYEKINGII